MIEQSDGRRYKHGINKNVDKRENMTKRLVNMSRITIRDTAGRDMTIPAETTLQRTKGEAEEGPIFERQNHRSTSVV